MTRLALALAACIALAPAASARAQDDLPARLRRLVEARVRADFTADRAALDTLLADDLTYARSSGVVDDKRGVLAQLGPAGPYALDRLAPDSLVARAFGEAGVVTGILHIQLRAQPTPYRIRFTDTWVLRGARWQLVAFQATRLP